jgi:hypothetical protein
MANSFSLNDTQFFSELLYNLITRPQLNLAQQTEILNKLEPKTALPED